MNGYDIDGVLVPRRVEPEKPYVIISGRTPLGWDADCEALARTAAVYIFPDSAAANNRENAGHWKAIMIGVLGVTRFYEDDPLQAAIIREECPMVTVVLVCA